MKNLIPSERIINNIHIIRGKRIMLDRDLALLYGVKTFVLNQAVKRNMSRFPNDFIFKLTKDEEQNLKSQSVISSWGGKRKPTTAFTEHGVAMLSSVLNSERAIQTNIQIIRTFGKLREMLATNVALRKKLAEMEKKYDSQFKVVFDVIKQMLAQESTPKRKIGF